MATQDNMLCVTLEAGADLSTKQFYFVSVASDGQIDPTGDGLDADGVLQDAPAAAGRAALVAIAGKVKVVCGGAVTRGGPVASDSAGKAVNATTAGDIILGTALETGADGRIIEILFQPRGAVPAA
jgi:hypothetical protein